jgi:hypothetical protein
MVFAERIKTFRVFQGKDDMEDRMNREQQKEKIRRQRKKRIMELMYLGCHQALISRILGVSKPTVGKLQVEMGVPARFPVSQTPVSHTTRPYRKKSLAKKLVDEATQRFFGGQLPQDTDQLAKVMTNFPATVPDKLKNKMSAEQWEQYRTHLANDIVAEIHAREARQFVN